MDILQAEFAATKEHAVQLERDSESFHLEQCELAEKLRGELAQSRQHVETLQAELASVRQIRCESDTALQEQQRTVEALRMELAGSRQQLAVLEAEAVATREQKQTLIDGAKVELAQRHEELERLRDELARAQQLSSELVGRIESGEDKTRDLQRQAEELRARFDAALAEKQELGRKLESLQQDNEARRGDSSLLESRHKEQLELVERLTADKQAAEDALARLRNEWNVERDALQDEIGQSRGQLAELLSRLEQSGENSGRENLHLQEELQSRVNAYQERLEQQEHRHAELQQEQAVIADGIQMLEAERDSLKTRLDGLAQEKASQQQEIEKLNAQVDSLKIAADSVVQALNEKLENERQRADEAEIQSSEHLSRIEALRVELASQKENNTGLIVDVEMLQKQEVELREEMQLTEDRFRARDQDNQESLKKAYEDLTRKNEIEREMQGQIERLRKKLEQSEESLQSARHDERESVENIRNELNAERRARAEERAQMAARQRELKEQLVSVASQHEVVLATQEGVVAQARDDAREEERTRLSQIIAMQQQTEQQLAALQDELRRAHEETTAAVRQEREGNEADLALAQRQKADADAALSQIETQLRQLMQERDAALAEQQAIREQLNALRAEVEVARGLINAERQGLAGDPIRLIAELKETRRNIEIAVRLRSEAEAQRDRAVAQLDELRHGRGAQVSTDARSPEDIGNSQQVTPTQSTRKGGAAGHSELNPTIAPSGSSAAGVPGNDAGRGWQGKMLGFGVVVLAALAFWFMHQTENPPTLKDSAVDGAVPAVTVRDIPAEAPVAVDIAPVKDTALTKPVSPPRTDRPAQQTPSAVNSPVVDKPHATRVAPVRSFQDELAGGGSGPVMVELPAANYLMGSAGNSLNFEERPQHPVDLPAYAIGKYEVRFAEYDRFAQATGRHLPYDEGWGRDDRPAINVSWKDAVAYTRWLSEQTGHEYRLPSESEWEFAARAGTTTAFWWDGKTNGSSANCFDCGSRWDGTSTAPVGSFPANSFGLYDTAGNVQEWAEDCYHSGYQDAPSDGSTWQASGCTQRVVRGGSYTSPLDSVRSARRGQYDQDTRLDNLGFRVVRVK